MTEAVSFIKEVGFTTFVALYLLIRIEPTLRSLQKSIEILTVVIAKSNGTDLLDVKQMCNVKDR